MLRHALLRRARRAPLCPLPHPRPLSAAPEPPPPPPPAPSRWYVLTEDLKDVLSVAFGVERKRNVEKEYDMGLRAYPWVTYEDPATKAPLYRNEDTGVVTPHKPLDFDKRATPASFRGTNEAATALMKVAPELSAWERTLRALGATPVIQRLLEAGEEVKKSSVGLAAQRVRARASEVREDLQEKWETSQHP